MRKEFKRKRKKILFDFHPSSKNETHKDDEEESERELKKKHLDIFHI